jgi:HK97 family phage major capsid protein
MYTDHIGLTERETKRFSFIRAINAMANPGNRAAQDAAGFEFECSQAAQKVSGRNSRGLMVPQDVLVASRANMVAGTGNVGGYLKATELHPESFVDALRNRCAILKAGAMEMSGLVGDVAVPKITTGTVASWVAEDSAVSQTNPVLGQMTLTPRQCGAYVDISKKLMVQATPAADVLVQNDLSQAIATAIDLAAIHGTGTNQPTGIIGAAGTGISGVSSNYTDATNGAAPTYAHLVSLETAVASANGDAGNLCWITNAKVRGKLRQLFANSYSTVPLWTNAPGGTGDGEILGYRALVTNQVSSTTTRGSSTSICSWALFGNFADLVIGFWSGLDLTVDPYSLSTTGQVRVVAIQMVDINLRQAASMAYLGGILTT